MGGDGAAVRRGSRTAVRGGARGRAQDQGDHGHPGGGHLGGRPPPRADRGGARRRARARARRRRRRPRGRARGGRARARAGGAGGGVRGRGGRRAAAAAGSPGGARGLPGDRARAAARARPWPPPAASTPTRRPGSRRSPQRSERSRNEEQVQQVHVRSACSRGPLRARPRGMRRRRRLEHERRRRRRRRRGGGGKTIALLLPETKTTRYEEKDRPLFEAKVKELCPDCKVFYQNASQDPNKQQQQAEAAITKGASVLVLDAVDVCFGRPDRAAREPEEHPRDRVRPADPRPGHRVLRVVRQREAGPRPGAVAASTSSAPADGQVDRDGERRADRPERGRLQEGRPPGVRQERPEDRQGVRHARLEPRQGPDRDGAVDHRRSARTASWAPTRRTTAWPAASSPR